jgi:hypothetical protein
LLYSETRFISSAGHSAFVLVGGSEMNKFKLFVTQRPTVGGPVSVWSLLLVIVIAWLTLNRILALSHLALVDVTFVATAVLFNLLIVGVYISQKKKRFALVKFFGSGVISLTIPLVIIFTSYLVAGRESWILVLFAFIFLYLLVELLFDYVLKLEFREKPILHIPYIVLFYIALGGFIGIAFTINATGGYLVSITFWMLLASLIYSFAGRKKAGSAG